MSADIVAESDCFGNLQSEYVFFNSERVAEGLPRQRCFLLLLGSSKHGLGAAAALPGPKGVGTTADMAAAARVPSLIGFSKAEAAMVTQSMKNLAGAGYDVRAFQQLVRSTDMPAGTSAMSLSTSPTGAALGDGAFASQQMLDHTLEEELRHLGQNLSNKNLVLEPQPQRRQR